VATSLEGLKKTKFELIIVRPSSNKPENLAKIGLADFEIIRLTKIFKK